MKTILVDDEQDARESLRELLRLFCPYVQVVAEADSMPSAIQAIRLHQPDLVLLDVQLGSNTGFDLLSAFPTAQFQIVFITGYDQFALRAFRFNAVDYLLKPVVPADLAQAIEKAQKKEHLSQLQIDNLLQTFQSPTPDRMAVSMRNGMVFIALKEIMRLEGEGNYTHFHLSNGETIMASRHMKSFEGLLPYPPFFRVHQSHIINLDFMKQLLTEDGGMSVMMHPGTRVPVSRRNKDNLLEAVRLRYSMVGLPAVRLPDAP